MICIQEGTSSITLISCLVHAYPTCGYVVYTSSYRIFVIDSAGYTAWLCVAASDLAIFWESSVAMKEFLY